ncbi:MAG: hypothetical protein I8H76_07515 [Burkholderiales bacterium]|nr:hypothetical protein [Burkholderiales bacterium]MBH2017923.1 hypothetical protein [Burkholderiales bacterium]
MKLLNQARVLAVLSAATLLTCEAVQAETVVGFARDAASQRFLYTEVHDFNRSPDGRVQTATSRYYDAQGKELARKSLDYRANRLIPLYKLEMPAQRYVEGISSNADPVVVFKQDQGKEERKSLAREGGLEAADSGFNHLLMDQLPRLLKGETVSFKLIVAGNTDRYRFRARQVGELMVGQEAAVRLRVEPDSLLRLVVDPIELVYDTQGSRLISYQGVSNIIDPATGQVHKQVSITYGGPVPAEARWPQRAAAANATRPDQSPSLR